MKLPLHVIEPTVAGRLATIVDADDKIIALVPHAPNAVALVDAMKFADAYVHPQPVKI